MAKKKQTEPPKVTKKKKKKYTYQSSIPAERKRKKRLKLTGLKAFLGTLFVLFVLAAAACYAYAAHIIMNAEKIHPDQIYETLELSTQIYDDKDRLLDEIYYDENRKIITYEQLPDNLKNAFIAVEDKTFWEHNGFNFRRIIGALLDAYKGGRIGGTSTISQQLARNIFLPEEKEVRSIERKITEMYYAYQIEEQLSKEEILTAYLNTIYLGYSCYGVDTASRKYFSKEVEELSLEECAALAALPQAPGMYSLLVTEEGEKTTEIGKELYVNDLSEERRYMVLDLMAEQKMISQEDADAAKKPATEFVKPGKETAESRSSFRDYLIATVVKDLAEKYGYTEEQAEKEVYTKGLKIYSTLDTQAQAVITKEFKDDDNFPYAEDDAKVEAAMVICEIGTGKVKAMVGGTTSGGQLLFNRATSPRQPGSSIKPIAVYAPALQKSFEYASMNQKFPYVNTGYDRQGTKGYGDYITTSSQIIDERMTVKGENWPQNYGNWYSGKQTFRTALQNSINTCAIKILAQVSIEDSMEMVHKFGVTTIVDDYNEPYNDINLAALGLGAMTEGVTPLDMSLAYATFPNGGVRCSPVCYTKVLDKDGNVILEGKAEEVQVLDEGVAWIMTDVLKSVVSKGIAGNAKIEGEETGGKTGTTNDNYDIWFDGFTPNCAAALWIGTDENVSMQAESSMAAALWSKIISQVDIARGGTYRAMPGNVIKKNGEYYTKGTEPKDKKKTTNKSSLNQNQNQDQDLNQNRDQNQNQNPDDNGNQNDDVKEDDAA